MDGLSPFGVCANVVGVDRVLRKGAKVWVTLPNLGGGHDHIEVTGLSRSGRRVRKWVAIHRLGNFRAKFIPPPCRDAMGFERPKAEQMAETMGMAAEAERTRRASSPPSGA